MQLSLSSNDVPAHLRRYFRPRGRCGVCYICHLVEVFEGVRRVLRDDGLCMVNIGDSYWTRSISRQRGNRDTIAAIEGAAMPSWREYAALGRTRYSSGDPVLKDKDLNLVPQHLAIELQRAGWWVRSVMPWPKRACLPESTTDRPTSAFEYILMLAKSARYFWDAEAVRRDHKESSIERAAYSFACARKPRDYPDGGHQHGRDDQRLSPAGRNMRNTDLLYDGLGLLIEEQRAYLAHLEGIRDNGGLMLDEDGEPLMIDATAEPLREEHYAAYPSKLIRPLIAAGTPEAGCCPKCGKAWKRLIEHENAKTYLSARGVVKKAMGLRTVVSGQVAPARSTTLGWSPACTCAAGPAVPSVVLDLFLGSGTSAIVARQLGRRCIGIDASETYAKMAVRRLEGPLFTPEEMLEETR